MRCSISTVFHYKWIICITIKYIICFITKLPSWRWEPDLLTLSICYSHNWLFYIRTFHELLALSWQRKFLAVWLDRWLQFSNVSMYGRTLALRAHIDEYDTPWPRSLAILLWWFLIGFTTIAAIKVNTHLDLEEYQMNDTKWHINWNTCEPVIITRTVLVFVY